MGLGDFASRAASRVGGALQNWGNNRTHQKNLSNPVKYAQNQLKTNHNVSFKKLDTNFQLKEGQKTLFSTSEGEVVSLRAPAGTKINLKFIKNNEGKIEPRLTSIRTQDGDRLNFGKDGVSLDKILNAKAGDPKLQLASKAIGIEKHDKGSAEHTKVKGIQKVLERAKVANPESTESRLANVKEALWELHSSADTSSTSSSSKTSSLKTVKPQIPKQIDTSKQEDVESLGEEQSFDTEDKKGYDADNERRDEFSSTTSKTNSEQTHAHARAELEQEEEDYDADDELSIDPTKNVKVHDDVADSEVEVETDYDADDQSFSTTSTTSTTSTATTVKVR